jgi:hypothetical protein
LDFYEYNKGPSTVLESLVGMASALQVMLQIPKDCEDITSEWVVSSTKEDDYEIKCTTTCTNDHGGKANSTVAIDFTLDEAGSLTCNSWKTRTKSRSNLTRMTRKAKEPSLSLPRTSINPLCLLGQWRLEDKRSELVVLMH